MTTTLTTNIQLSNQGTGDNSNSWGVVLNGNNTTLDAVLGSTFSVSVAGNTDYTLSQTNANNLKHTLTGTLTGNINYIFPSNEGRFVCVYNNTSGAFTVTVKQSGGTGIVVPQGYIGFLILDANTTTATQAHNWLTALAIGIPSTTTGVLTLFNSTNGNTTTLQSGVASGNITWTLPTADGSANQFLKTNGSGTLSFATPSAGVTSFSGDGTILSNSSSTGAVTASLANASANTILAGPTTGAATTPTYRAIVSADLPLATSGAIGGCQVDGTTITASSGVISAVAATPSVFAVGAYMTGVRQSGNATAGSTYSGSTLTVTDAQGNSSGDSSPSGTWRAMTSNQSQNRPILFLRTA